MCVRWMYNIRHSCLDLGCFAFVTLASWPMPDPRSGRPKFRSVQYTHTCSQRPQASCHCAPSLCRLDWTTQLSLRANSGYATGLEGAVLPPGSGSNASGYEDGIIQDGRMDVRIRRNFNQEGPPPPLMDLFLHMAHFPGHCSSFLRLCCSDPKRTGPQDTNRENGRDHQGKYLVDATPLQPSLP